ncbi:hypothetical protein [Pararhizobium sp. PWRC1-1]|uniref:hypothetical protein n=1 Tax=Pararhizobium sp. PWRC1-1 TaxID=2804566 RepID=UPI003CF26621
MFERAVEWTKIVGMIGDIAKGTSTVSLRQYTKSLAADDTSLHPVFGWDYHRVQAHGGDTRNLPALVSDAQLTDILSSLTTGPGETYAYEVDGTESFDGEAQSLLLEFSSTTVTTVKLSVGVVHLGWFLISLETNRDVVHWKMRYHERNLRPSSPSSA